LKEYEQNPKKYNVSTLRKGIMAGALCPRILMENCINKLNLSELQICYGLTEASGVSFQTFTDDTMDNKTNTIGRVHDHIEAKIIDQNGKVVPHGTPGEICVRGYSVMLSYWGDADATNKAIDKQRWCKTEDLGVISENGYCQVVGRIKDMIIRGGENVYPKEIEDFFLSVPNVENCQVIGVPDEKYGEEIMACIKLKDDKKPIAKKDILQACHKKIAHYKIPKFVKFVDGYPMTVTGKIQKYKMRDEVVQELSDPKLYEEYKVR